MKRLFWFLILPLIVIAGLIFGGNYAYKNRLYAPFSDMIGDDTKAWLKDTVLVFQTKSELEAQVEELNARLAQTDDVQELLEEAMRRDPNLPPRLPFRYVGRQTLDSERDRFVVDSFETPFVPLDYFGRRAYLALHGDDLLLVSGKGTIATVPLAEVTGEEFTMTTLPTNLPRMIRNPEFFALSELSIKDVAVMGDRLLLSYSRTEAGDCIALSVAAAELGGDTLTFEDIFVPDECIGVENDYGEFSGNQSGGRMIPLDGNRLLMSTGEMRYRDKAQDPESFYGKIVEIDLGTGDWTAHSMGHRNPQGVYIDEAAGVIVVSEHGPEGGDELNINRSLGGEIENYGWPVSSYGEHYSTDQIYYDKAPLHKSHADHGFIEPDLHWSPSISPTELLRLGPDPRDPDRYAILMGTMGFDWREGDESLHVFDLDGDFRVSGQTRVVLDDRVRDMIALPEPNRYALYLEGDSYEFGTIAIVTANPPAGE